MKNLWLVIFAAVCTVVVGYVVTTFDETTTSITQQEKQLTQQSSSALTSKIHTTYPDLFGADMADAFKQVGYQNQQRAKGEHPTMSEILKKRWMRLFAIQDFELSDTHVPSSINVLKMATSMTQLATEVYLASLHELNQLLDIYNAPENSKLDEPAVLLGLGQVEAYPSPPGATATMGDILTAAITDGESIGWWWIQMGRRKAATTTATTSTTIKDIVWLGEHLQALHTVLIHPMWATSIGIQGPCFSASSINPPSCMEAVSAYFTKVAGGGVASSRHNIDAALLVPVSYYYSIVLPKYRVQMMSTADYIEDQILQNTTSESSAARFAAGMMKQHANDLLVGIDHLRLLGVFVNLLDQGFPRMVSPYAVPLSGRLDIALQRYQRAKGKAMIRDEALNQLRTSLLGYTDFYMCPKMNEEGDDTKTASFVATVFPHLCHKFVEEMVLPTRGIEGRIGSLLEEMLMVYTSTLTTNTANTKGSGGGGREDDTNIGVVIAPYLLYYSYLIKGPASLARAHCPWASKKIAADLSADVVGGGKSSSTASTALQLRMLEAQGQLSKGCQHHVVTFLQGLVDSCDSKHFEQRSRAVIPDSRWAMMSSGAPQGGDYLFGGSTTFSSNGTRRPSSTDVSGCVCELWEMEGVSGLCRPLIHV